MWHSGRKSQRRQSQILPASMRSFFFFAAAMARSINGCATFSADLTEGQPMGHSVRACMIGMRLAQQVGMSVDEQAELCYALLLKDAGCSSNASRLFHILNADEIKAKGDLKTKDWTRIGWESLHYALTHVCLLYTSPSQ